ncbi:hypothetical protein MLD38_026956 [Melastoma candidum]|uniref:Uncharacterized protein n=1 Tax=Melastoma candidum TaxID=119954 RepID=A0ACB9P519_9MYRT|nr:hypothetical protein MLD38_026956 [Melastoma candidum]
MELCRCVHAELVLKEREVNVLIHHVPSDQLSLVPCHDGDLPMHRGLGQLARGQRPHPPEVKPRVVPEYAMAADFDRVVHRESHERISSRVVLAALGVLNGVPLHLVLKHSYAEPLSEPLLIRLVFQDVRVYGAA